MNIKKRKESLRDFYLRANAWNLQLQSKNRFLKSDVDAASPQSHEKMIEVMTVWSARIRHDNYNVMQQSRDTLLSQVNSLNEEVQNFLQRKERDAYKNKLRELVPLQQEYNVLDEKCDTYELVGVLKQLHDVGGPLDIEYISSTEQEKYRNVLQQSCSTQLDATIRYVEDKIQYMKPLVQSTQDDIIALLVPGVQNCMEEMKIPAPLQQDTAQDLIRFVLEQVEYCKNNGITGVLLQDYIQKNHLQWMHRAYLKNEAHEENIRRCSFEQLGCIENMKKRMIEKFID